MRDRINLTKLGGLGSEVMVVWEGETKDIEALAQRLVKFIDGGPKPV